jgi:hypothetical protein
MEAVGKFILVEYLEKYEKLDPLLQDKIQYIRTLEDMCMETCENVE